MNSVRTVCTLMPLAACQFSSNAPKFFKEGLQQQTGCLKLELSTKELRDTNLRLNMSNRQYTVALRYPSNGLSYIALNH